jgi:hypothetical protein
MQAMSPPRRFAVQAAAIGSAGAGLVHAAAVGTHAEEPTLVWIFALCAIAQVGLAGMVLLRPTRMMLAALGAVNAAAFATWALSRTTGLPAPSALSEVEAVGTADLIGAVFAVVAVCGALAFVVRPASKRVLGPAWTAVTLAAALILSVPALAAGASHNHDHGTAGHAHGAAHDDGHAGHDDHAAGSEHADHADGHAAGDDHGDHADGHAAGEDHADHDDHDTDGGSGDGHDHGTTEVAGATTTHHDDHGDHPPSDPTPPPPPSAPPPPPTHPHPPSDPTHPHPPSDPTDPPHEHPPSDPTDPPHEHPPSDPSGPVISLDDPRLTPAERSAAQQLITVSTEALARYSDTASVEAAGYNSIGDAGTGWEHFVNGAYLADAYEMDPTRVESIVFQVNPDGTKHLASAMYILSLGKTMADVPDIAGELTTWHDHQNLCWSFSPALRVVGVTGPDGTCSRGVFMATPPMLHVWMQPHPCGPFAGIEGTHGEGCGHAHPTDPAPSGPIVSIDDPRLTAGQREAARQLIEVTREGMTPFRDVASVEAAGYRSIGDAGTGWEHFVNWDYYNDGIEMDPARIESIVFEVLPGGDKRVASAMYILNPGKTMGDVPEIAGELTTWHDHQNLCWSVTGTPRVVGVTGPDGSCSRGVFMATPPMLHVWMQEHACGPFAGIDGSAHGDCVGHEH